jgi:membrane associated rhomboid family serine protease
MRTGRFGQGFFEIPHAAVYTPLITTLIISGLPFIQAGGPGAPGDLLYRYGAMYSGALARHEYWRLVAYGFLHFDFVHLTMNMLCLVLWGGHLEKRIGSLYFLIVYFSAMILGAIIGDLAFAGPYLTVGASGATSGILGALLCLWILGKAGLDANFFAINIGLNIAFAITNPKVNWRIHLGGFVIGLITCAVLDLVEKLNARLLRCKFPEFVKINLAILACAAAPLLFGNRLSAAAGPKTLMMAIAFLVACCLVIKLADIVLSAKKGLAALALANGAVIGLGSTVLAAQFASSCGTRWPGGFAPIQTFVDAACSNPWPVIGLFALGAATLTYVICSKPFHRGMADVGFVGASLRAERNRRRGI